MLKVEYNGQEYDALGIYDTGSGGGTIAVLVGVRLFLSGAGSYSDPIPVGEVTVLNGGSSGGAGVSSINTLDGDITLAAGSNVTLTPVGNTITIAATAGTPGANSVTTAMIQNNAITSAKIADGTILPADMAAGAINTYLNTNGSGVVGWVELPAASGVTSFNGRTGVVEPEANDYTAAQVGAIPDDFYGVADGVAPLDSTSKVPYSYLPIGTVANTIARGDDPRFGVAAFISRSNTAPGSPAAGDVWFRYLDSGLTSPDEPYVYVTAAGANAFRSLIMRDWKCSVLGGTVATPPAGQIFELRSGKTWFYNCEVAAFITTTNDASNYWTFSLRSFDAANSVVQTLATFNTSAVAANGWRDLGGLINSGDGLVVDSGGTERIVYLSVSATGNPGAISFGSTVRYRYQHA